MKLLNIAFSPTTQIPTKITVEMDLMEAMWIAGKAGTEKPTTVASHQVYDTLVGGMFNRYWEDGLQGAQRGDTE